MNINYNWLSVSLSLHFPASVCPLVCLYSDLKYFMTFKIDLIKWKSTIGVKFVFISFTGNGSERLQDSDCRECETESGVSTSVGDRPGNCLYEKASVECCFKLA